MGIGEHRTRRTRGGRLAAIAVVAAAAAVDLVFWAGDRDLSVVGTLPIWVVPVLALGCGAVLLLRHRHPVAVWTAQWVYTGVNFLIPAYFPFAYLLVAAYTVAARTPFSVATRILPLTALSLGLFSYHSALATPGAQDVRQFLVAATIWAMLLTVVWGIGRLVHHRDRQALADRRRMAADAERALAAQRRHLARELHDSVSGTVAGMVLYAGAARAAGTGADPHADRALEAIEQAGARAIAELHTLLGLLRSPDTHAPRRLDAIEELIALTRAGGITVHLTVTGDPPSAMAPDIDLTAYRIVQESLTNITKHAGRGADARIAITWRPDTVTVTITSGGGRGPTAGGLSSGHGLRGLRERVREVGGHMESGPADAGWRVHTELPLTGRGIAAGDSPR
ncbi:sensor histidine kinase [Nocardia takedensis]|uniref:sensor histidine kinase n=1 Tax=Nocardia takedensis TaxID=259390 RepID=UPI000314D82D|nr:histidine kinase [Nocardia takedensis]